MVTIAIPSAALYFGCRHAFREIAKQRTAAPSKASSDATAPPIPPLPVTSSPKSAAATPEKFPDVKTIVHRPEAHIDYQRQLENMIGLNSVKTAIKQFVASQKFQKMRQKEGLSATRSSMHLVFTGNPGTGKTTVARILGGILSREKYLQSGHVVEVSVPEMIGRYIGETPQKVQNVVQQALDGVLFIDEAYSLLGHTGIGSSFGDEAIATLLKMMEDHRDRLCVIAAGYPNEMMKFIDANPGFRSRFTDIIHFEDYTPADLEEIFYKMMEQEGYTLSPEAALELEDMMGWAAKLFFRNFPNGRYVRNLFEDAIKNLGARVTKISSPTRQDLMTISKDDLTLAFAENKPKK